MILLLDNHDITVNIDVIQETTYYGVSLITFPPYCRHGLQSLDVSLYGPLKAHYNQACGSWMLSYPGKTLTIWHIAELRGTAFHFFISSVKDRPQSWMDYCSPLRDFKITALTVFLSTGT